ncbi:MAG: ANTAR domain-containing protein, partial [Phycicoccus sp.]
VRPGGPERDERISSPAPPDEAQVRGLVAEVAQLKAALASRAGIGQAVGILMAHHGCGADDAFAMLRKASNDTNVRLADLAATIVGDASGASSERRASSGGGDAASGGA